MPHESIFRCGTKGNKMFKGLGCLFETERFLQETKLVYCLETPVVSNVEITNLVPHQKIMS